MISSVFDIINVKEYSITFIYTPFVEYHSIISPPPVISYSPFGLVGYHTDIEEYFVISKKTVTNWII